MDLLALRFTLMVKAHLASEVLLSFLRPPRSLSREHQPSLRVSLPVGAVRVAGATPALSDRSGFRRAGAMELAAQGAFGGKACLTFYSRQREAKRLRF